MEITKPLQQAFREAYFEAHYDREKRARRALLNPLHDWINDLVQRPLPADWRGGLDRFLASLESSDFRLTPGARSTVERWIERWARFRGFLPEKGNGPVTAAAHMPSIPAERPFVIHVTPQASGPPNQQAEPPRQAAFINGVEVAGDGPQTTASFRAKVQTALEILDRKVAVWWKRPSVAGIVRSRDASSWRRFLLADFYSESLKNGPAVIVVDRNYDAGQTAAAIVSEARENLTATSIGPRFRADKMARGDAAEEQRRWDRDAVRQAAAEAGALAELYVKLLASVTAGGDLVVTVGDVAQHGISWDQLALLLPLMARLPEGVKHLVIRTKTWTVRLPKETARELAALGKRGQAILKNAEDAASSGDEALAIIKRDIATSRRRAASAERPRKYQALRTRVQFPRRSRCRANGSSLTKQCPFMREAIRLK